MTRRRAGLVVVAVLVLALLGLGLWRRQQLLDERDAARVTRRHTLAVLVATHRRLVRTSNQAGAVEIATVGVRKQAAELRGVADGVAAQITAVQKQRDDAVLAAFVANGQVTTLRTCLDGINRALNQVSVGDPSSVRTLDSVRSACRAVS